jgi:hypothetical protein
MRYTVTSLPVAETASDVNEALGRARQMYEAGLASISIRDHAGRKTEGDEFLACLTGKKRITPDLGSI